jgi:hypothetical protein
VSLAKFCPEGSVHFWWKSIGNRIYARTMKTRYNSYSENPNNVEQYIKIVLSLILNEAQHVSGDTPLIIRSLQDCTLSYATWQRPTTARPTTFQVCKTKGCLCSFRLLMMDGVSPETCWASFKIRNNKILTHFCILLGFSLYELYHDARIHEHQVYENALHYESNDRLGKNYIPYFSIDNAHIMYNAQPKHFRHSFGV